MHEELKIATWNLCLGLFNKVDYVKNCLQKHNIDVLGLQETEIKPDVPLKTLHIPGYSIEVEKNLSKKRVAIYVSNRIKYRRRHDLEAENTHLIILDIGNNNKYRIFNIYRPFNPVMMTERAFFTAQLTNLNSHITPNSIIMGDFNLDLNKENDLNYGKRPFLDDMNNYLGHHHLEQLILEDTWSRIINGNNVSSRIDHIYTTCQDNIQRLYYHNEAYSDHLLVMFSLNHMAEASPSNPTYRRSWYGYNKYIFIVLSVIYKL